ncbi:MAG: histidine kinase [Acidobacteriaceae bacterium]|nr:histidine kinase [Acidobacteriaceae bacterium]
MSSIRHPIFRSRNTIRAYLATWIPLAMLFRFTVAFAGQMPVMQSVALTVPLVLLLALVCLWPWYACRLLPLTSSASWTWKPVAGHVVMAMWISAAVIAIMHVIASLYNRVHTGISAHFAMAVPALAGTIFLTYLLATALHYVVLAVEASRQAELLSREAQLKALKAQVNPHFLFNSLNSISALTAIDPARAREMCVKLSDFLRNSLRLGERNSVPFSEELALAQTYLDVEQVRFGQRLRVRQDFDKDCSACDIPPLLLQPLVENSIKHGIATLVEGGEIGITGRKSKDAMRLTVENPFDPDAPATGKSGFGLINVRNRLEARWGKSAKLEIHVDRNRYRVTMAFPCERAKRA